MRISKLLKSIAVFILAIVGGIAYRMGGSGNFPRYFRELGQGICAVLAMICMGMLHWSLVLCFGVVWAESTYFKKKGTDGTFFNFLLVGAVFGLIPLPYSIATNSHWIGFGIRLVLCTVLTPVYNFYISVWIAKLGIKRDISDEFGRGFINIASLPLLLIGA